MSENDDKQDLVMRKENKSDARWNMTMQPFCYGKSGANIVKNLTQPFCMQPFCYACNHFVATILLSKIKREGHKKSQQPQ